MRICVFGLGYVGCVSAACLARDGHTVIGVDVNPQKVELVGSGRSPVLEPGLEKLLGEMVGAGRLVATQDGRAAVRSSDVSVVCVGTPSNDNGSLDLRYVERVCQEIGAALAESSSYHVVVVRSTVLPGTVEEKLIPILQETSGRHAGTDFGVCMNPEFLREGAAIDDYYHPSQIVIGELTPLSGAVTRRMYEAVEAPVVHTSIRIAEMTKYVSNAFHALKIAFANEIGNLAKAHGVDGRRVMEVFAMDRRLNISPAYLRPGFAFGGSCLPKDMRALVYRARELDITTPLLNSVLQSNQEQIQRGIRMVEKTGRKRVAVLGLSFKPDTDDVRESPSVPLIETLLGRGYQVSVYDEKVDPSALTGANKSYLERELPHIASLMRSSIEEAVTDAEVVVIANSSRAFRRVPDLLNRHQVLIDLVGITGEDGSAPSEASEKRRAA
ncbi:MAG: UDP-glucose dehydrogenase family protein [Sphingomonadaceae bacterium]